MDRQQTGDAPVWVATYMPTMMSELNASERLTACVYLFVYILCQSFVFCMLMYVRSHFDINALFFIN